MSRDFVDGLVSRSYVPLRPRTVDISGPSKTDARFQEILRQAYRDQTPDSGLKISAHAMQRMRERGMELNSNDLFQLGQAVDKAGNKGSRDAYLMYGDTGFIVNVPNRTVITAVVNSPDTVVTNIDSVVIVPRPDHRVGASAAVTD